MADMHTPLPWSIKNRQDTVEIVGADGVAVAKTSWHNSLRRPYPLRAEAAANMALIVAAVNAPSQDAETVKALEERAAYWKGASDRMAARNHELNEQVAKFGDRLSLRDTFIVEKGLWHEFATTVLPSASLSASQKERAL